MAERTKSEVKWKKNRLRRRRKQDELTGQVSLCCETHMNELVEKRCNEHRYRGHAGEKNLEKDDLGTRDPIVSVIHETVTSSEVH